MIVNGLFLFFGRRFEMGFYRKLPVTIEAREYTRNGLEAERVAKWCGGQQTDEGIIIKTLEGDHLGNYGDFIIKGVNGEFYPCKPEIFWKTYEEDLMAQ
jgi:hypothetical protein